MSEADQLVGVENCRLDLGNLGFLLASKLLCSSLIGATLQFVLDAISVGVSEIPNLAAFAIRCHWVRLLSRPGRIKGAGWCQPSCPRLSPHYHPFDSRSI